MLGIFCKPSQTGGILSIDGETTTATVFDILRCLVVGRKRQLLIAQKMIRGDVGAM